MNIKLKNTNRKRVFNLPCCIFDDYIKVCNEAQLKVLLYLYASDDEILSDDRIASITGLNISSVDSAIEYWISKGEITNISSVDSPDTAVQPTLPKRSTVNLTEYVKTNADFKHLVADVERCLGRTLTHYEKQALALMRDYYKFSDSSISIIIEHCSKREHFSASYVETVAKSLHDKGIVTYEQIEHELTSMDEYYSFESEAKRSLGLTAKLSKKQSEYLASWRELGFSVDMIALAGDMCLNSTNKIAFPYMNKIILNWAEKKLFTVEAVEAENKAAAEAKGADKIERSFDLGEFDDFTLGDYIKSKEE